jgi:hypothetical protein
MESLVTLMGIIAFIILGTISHALMQDITDPITGRTIRDKETDMLYVLLLYFCYIGIFLANLLPTHPILHGKLV